MSLQHFLASIMALTMVCMVGSVAANPPQPLTIHFGTGTTQVDTRYDNILASYAKYLAQHPELNTQLVGHADEVGSRAYSVSLGYVRAEAVREVLARFGVADDRMTGDSMGEEKPIDPGHTKAAFSANRRVEVRLDLIQESESK